MISDSGFLPEGSVGDRLAGNADEQLQERLPNDPDPVDDGLLPEGSVGDDLVDNADEQLQGRQNSAGSITDRFNSIAGFYRAIQQGSVGAEADINNDGRVNAIDATTAYQEGLLNRGDLSQWDGTSENSGSGMSIGNLPTLFIVGIAVVVLAVIS